MKKKIEKNKLSTNQIIIINKYLFMNNNSIFETKKGSDLILISNDKIKFNVHKNVLMKKSYFFNSLLCGKYNDSQSSEIHLDHPGIIIKSFLRYIYTNEIYLNNLNLLIDFLSLADKLCLEKLKDKINKEILDKIFLEKNQKEFINKYVDVMLKNTLNYNLSKTNIEILLNINNILTFINKQQNNDRLKIIPSKKFDKIIRLKIKKVHSYFDSMHTVSLLDYSLAATFGGLLGATPVISVSALSIPILGPLISLGTLAIGYSMVGINYGIQVLISNKNEQIYQDYNHFRLNINNILDKNKYYTYNIFRNYINIEFDNELYEDQITGSINRCDLLLLLNKCSDLVKIYELEYKLQQIYYCEFTIKGIFNRYNLFAIIDFQITISQLKIIFFLDKKTKQINMKIE